MSEGAVTPVAAPRTLVLGDRITILYPENYLENYLPIAACKRVGQIAFIENASPPTWIDIVAQPQGYMVRLPLKEAAAAGVKLRPWTTKDGWPTMKDGKIARLSKVEKKQVRAKVAKAVRRKRPVAEEDDTASEDSSSDEDKST